MMGHLDCFCDYEHIYIYIYSKEGRVGGWMEYGSLVTSLVIGSLTSRLLFFGEMMKCLYCLRYCLLSLLLSIFRKHSGF